MFPLERLFWADCCTARKGSPVQTPRMAWAGIYSGFDCEAGFGQALLQNWYAVVSQKGSRSKKNSGTPKTLSATASS